MKQEDLDYWEDFENEIMSLEVNRRARGIAKGTYFLFRGQGSQDWHLETILSEKRKPPGVFLNIFN